MSSLVCLLVPVEVFLDPLGEGSASHPVASGQGSPVSGLSSGRIPPMLGERLSRCGLEKGGGGLWLNGSLSILLAERDRGNVDSLGGNIVGYPRIL